MADAVREKKECGHRRTRANSRAAARSNLHPIVEMSIMHVRSRTAVVLATLALAACAVQGPHLDYADFLPNTNEDPAWARKAPQSGAAGQEAARRDTSAPR